MFDKMEQYHFERKDFVDTFNKVFMDEEFIALYDLITCGYESYRFILTRHDDDFYILDTETGLLISWYKHLGRINLTNDKNLTLEDLELELTKLKKDLQENNVLI